MNFPFKNHHFEKQVRNAETTNIKDAIFDLLDFYRLKAKFNETHILNSWDEILGESVAKRTKKLYIRQSKLFVEITSSPLRNELFLQKDKIIKLLNDSIGEEILEDIAFL